MPVPSWARPNALILKEIDSAAGVLAATQQKDSQYSAAELAEGNNVKASVKGDDSFVLRNVESILHESPEERENQRRSLFGNASLLPPTNLIYQKIHW